VADVNANIDINIDSSNAISQLKSLQRQISQFHTSIAKSSESAALAQRGLEKNLLNSINSIGSFSAELRTVKTTAESFTTALEGNKFSMREYFRYAGGSTKTFGKLFRSEFDTIGKVAEERVKKLQTQYIKMGRDTTGAMKAIAVMPKSLDMSDYNTKIQVAAQKQALFNQLMKQGSTNLLNFGKNTQWAGRQLMVGFTIPLTILGSTASKTFMEMEAQALKFKKVYGDLFTPQAETQAALDGITELGQMFTKYGVAVSSTVGLAAEAAAAGFQGLDLQRQTTEATRLSILGQIENTKALETTISLQNAFGMSSDKLADSINFLNAVENQTVVSLDDITTAIPKVAPVIQQLGGDVKDLTFFIAAMKEGGINASEGANALKSGLAALINPTRKANAMLSQFGINAREIVVKNKGNLKATVVEFATALNQLDPLNRAQAIEQMFGKFQFARLSTLFANVAKDGNQASRVLDLANSSVEELSALSERELGMTAESSMNKFKKAVEDLKFALIPVGKAFLEAVTPIAEFVGNILSKFNDLSAGSKKAITLLVTVIGGLGPVLLMTFGLLANGVANIIKLFLTLRQGYQRLTGQSQVLGEQTQYLTMEQLDAAAVAHSLDQAHAKLTQRFTLEAEALNKLIIAYQSAATAGQRFAMNNPGMMLPPRAPKKLASGIVSVPGSGNKDTVPAMLAPGEAVIPSKFAKKYAPLIQGMVAGNIPGYKEGVVRDPGSGSAGRVGKVVPTVVRPYSSNVGATKGLVDFLNIDPGNTADVVSLYTKQILEEAKVSAQSVVVEINKWRQNNMAALQKAAAAVNAGADATTEFGPLVSKFNQDMETAQGPFSQFAKTAQTMAPKLSKDLVEAQQKAKELNLNVKNAADAVKLSQELPNNVIASNLSKPGNFSQYSKIRAGAGSRFGDDKGIESMGIPRFMLPDMHPSERAYKLGTSQEHVSSSVQQQEQAIRLKAERSARKNASVYQSEVEKNTTDIYPATRERTSPHKLAAQDGKDDANAYENAKQTATKQRRRSDRPQGPPSIGLGAIGPGATISPAGLQSVVNETRARQTATEKLGKLNGAIMGGTFALTSLASAGSMASGPLGDLSQQVMKYSGLLFGLMSITQLLTQAKVTDLVATRAGTVATAMGGTGFKSLFSKGGGLAGFGKNLLTAGKFLLRFLGPIGLVTTGLLAAYSVIKMVNAARERERLAIEGLGDAMATTTSQVKTLGEFFGVLPKKLPFDLRQTEIVSAPVRTQRENLKASPEFQKEFKSTIESLRKATNEEAKIVFSSLALNLQAQGFAKDQVQVIVDALREESSQTDVTLDVKSLNLSKESLDKLKKDFDPLLVSLNKALSDGITKKLVGGGGAKGASAPLQEIILLNKNAQKQLETTSQFISETSKSASGMFQLGLIDGKTYEATISAILERTNGLDEAQRKILLNDVFKKLGVSATALNGVLGDTVKEMRLLALMSSGILGKDSPVLKGLQAPKGTKEYQNALIQITRLYDKMFGAIEKASKVEPKPFNPNAGGAAGELSEIQKAINSLKEKTKQILDQSAAYKILRDNNYDAATAAELAADSLVAAALASGAIKAGTEKWKEFLEAIKKAKNALAVEPANKASQKFDTDKLAIEAQTKAMRTLLAAGYDAAEALDIVGDADLVALINNSEAAGLTFDQVKEKIDSAAEAIKNLKNLGNPFAAIEEQTEKFEKAFAAAMEKFRIEEEKAKKKFQPGIDRAQAEVDRIQKIIDGINKTIDGLQTKIKDKQRGIEENITREVEKFEDSIKVIEDKIKAEFDSPLEKLSSESEVLSHNLELIDHQSEAINSKYDLQAEALQKVSDINSDIADQQQKQLGLADALSRGDISAAAAAAQDMRAGSAARAASAQSGFLDSGRKAELAALTAGGMTRLKIEERQYQIGQEQYKLEQGRKLLQKEISDIQEFKIEPLLEEQKRIELDIRDIEDEIYKLENAQTNSLRSNNIELDAAKIALDEANGKLQEALDKIADQKKVWEDAKFGIDEAKNSVDILNTSLEETLRLAEAIAAAYASMGSGDFSTSGSFTSDDKAFESFISIVEALDAAQAAFDAAVESGNMYAVRNAGVRLAAAQAAYDATLPTGGGGGGGGNSLLMMSSGGMVPKYMAYGGMSMGSDTVPAMLTPGEFVMNKKATKAFGPALAAMNSSKYPSMMTKGLSSPTYQTSATNISAPSNVSNSTSVNNNSSSVYNYSVGINVGGSNANPQDIARAVMTQIKNVDSQRIRTQR
jgi:TP901 family phage tail tape measure protein